MEFILFSFYIVSISTASNVSDCISLSPFFFQFKWSASIHLFQFTNVLKTKINDTFRMIKSMILFGSTLFFNVFYSSFFFLLQCSNLCRCSQFSPKITSHLFFSLWNVLINHKILHSFFFVYDCHFLTSFIVFFFNLLVELFIHSV